MFLSGDSGRSQPIVPESFSALARGYGHYILEHGQLRERSGNLESASESFGEDTMRWQTMNSCAIQKYGTSICIEKP